MINESLLSGAGWSILVCFGLFGWGDILRRALRMRCDAGETACLGIGIATACGGVLNLLHLVLPVSDAGFVIIGVAAGARRAVELKFAHVTIPRRATTWWLLAAVCVLGVCATTFYCYNFEFQIQDDFTAYMVFPEKMLTGTLGFEPFSERRLFTSMGAPYFLQSLILGGADFHWLHVIDPVFALIVTIYLLDAAMRRRSVPLNRRLSLYLFLMLFLPRTLNLTFTLLPVPLFLFIWLVVADLGWCSDRTASRRSFCLALTIAALIAMKPVYTIPLGIFLAGAYLPRMLRGDQKARSLAEAVTIVALMVVLLMPWMVANWRQTGTAMYPFLGTGFSTANIVADVPPLWALVPLSDRLSLFLTAGLLNAPMLLLIALFVLVALSSSERRFVWHLADWIMATIVMVVALCIAGVGGANLDRYCYPAVATAILLELYAIASVRWTGFTTAIYPGLSTGLTVAACMAFVGYSAGSIMNYYGVGLFNLRLLYSGPAGTSETRQALVESLQPGGGGIGAAIGRMQASVPPGETILEQMDFPFLMDFRRNVIFVADWPGSVGPAPGWPSFHGAKQVAAYLTGQSVRYIAWAYGDEAFFPARRAGELPRDAWVATDAARAFDFHRSLSDMMRVCPLMFNDGARAIVHLTDACVEALPGKQQGEATHLSGQ